MSERLNAAFAPCHVQITDDSHKHIGHEGAKDGRGHFTVVIQSDVFKDLSPVQRHQAVYQAMGELMQTDIHALAIKATPLT